jgi:hypothetical protein
MTVRDTITTMLSYLRLEQRALPYAGGPDYADPLPDALAACNSALQQMAVLGPLFAAKQQRSAYFHAPATLAVTGLSNGGYTATGTFPAWASGCWVQLPDDPGMNRILSITGTTATLQFPNLSTTPSGTATINVDTVELDTDIITVLEPVRYRGSNHTLTAVSSREELAHGPGDDIRYFIESALSNGSIKLRLMLSGYVATDTVLEFQARTALGTLTPADVYTDATGHPDPGTALPVPANFVESIFLPLALDTFFSKPSITNYDIPSLRNQDAPALIHQQAQTALVLLERMRPQGRKPVKLTPGWKTPNVCVGARRC